MSFRRLVTRSLTFYWRTNLAVLLAVAVAAGVLTGALAVGDSVRYTLAMTLEARLGRVAFAVMPQGHFFRIDLAGDLQRQLGVTVAPVLQVSGMITNEDGSRRLNQVQVFGVTDEFYKVGPGGNPFTDTADEGVVVNEQVAKVLHVAAGDEILLRVEKPGLMPRDVPLVSEEDRTIASRVKVLAVAGSHEFGRFDLQANQVSPFSVFVPLASLTRQIGQQGLANMLLATDRPGAAEATAMSTAVKNAWKLADASVEMRRLEQPNVLELRSRRIFLDEALAGEAMRAGDGATGILTYFVNEIRLGEKATPYSIVAAVGKGAGAAGLLPQDMRPDEVVINQWLADDLGANVGDSLEMVYYRLGPMRKLDEENRRFRVTGIVPLEGPARDPTLMPEYPGLADVENCRDWKPGIPVNLDRIRPKDEQYWDEYRGTPKAFVTLEAGQGAWGNRYGNLTAVRYPWSDGITERIDRHLRDKLDPASVGLFFLPVRERGLRAGRGGTDFGSLFLGLSMFLIASAVILVGLLFVFGVENRSGQIGTLLAVGWPARRVKRLLLAEGGLVAALGSAAGVGVGLLYTRLMVYGLSTFWAGAVGGAEIQYHARWTTLLAGGFGGLIAALLAIWITLFRRTSKPACLLLTGTLEEGCAARRGWLRGRLGVIIGVACLIGAVTLLVTAAGGDSQATAGAFFGAGALLLLCGLGLGQALLRTLGDGWSRPMVSLTGLALRNATRRSGRSTAIIGLLACGVFMVVAVSANRRDLSAGPQDRSSGTGGFALYGRSSVAVLHDLNTEAGRKALGLGGKALDSVSAVQFRLREGDDASCLNLNRAQQPQLLGVDPEMLQRRGAFSFTATIKHAGQENGWDLLRMHVGGEVVPAVGDYTTIYWGLGKNIGDELEYRDEAGRPFRVRIVGMLASSILQGSLVIAENAFMTRFPSADGYRAFLVDAPIDRTDAVAQELSSGLKDYGLVLTPTRERLAAFSAVENTYLSIFMALGGLGLVLGSVGLGLVVLRNMLERRGELAMLRAVGFDRGRLKRMVFYEHWGLLLAGLTCGVVAAAVAVLPAVQAPGGRVPYVSLTATVVAIGISGAVWVWLAGTLALRGGLLDALRHE